MTKTWLQRWANVGERGGAMALVLLLMLAMLIVPLPPLVLDIMFSFNLGVSILVLTAVIQSERPLAMTLFPALLLVTTLLRLALNVASTRVVLLYGHEGPDAAGHVIEAFGKFVIGGHFVIGVLIFIILTLINFVVITKGAGRVSEVAARFTLDALPGKQMAIDADLNAGLITRDEAKHKREEVREEADFYGAMDGSSKFIRGDAIAGLLILFINIFGGLAMGIIEHGMTAGDATEVYVLLTIGDGLVAQIPALFISVAVAILVTRVSRPQSMGKAMMQQALGPPQTLWTAGGIMVFLGSIPGMPHMVFLALGGIFLAMAWKRQKNTELAEKEALNPTVSKHANPTDNKEEEVSWNTIAPTEALVIEIGYRLVELVDNSPKGNLLARIKGVRKKMSQQWGFLFPAVHIRDNIQIPPQQYRIFLQGSTAGQGELWPNHWLALPSSQGLPALSFGTATKDPAFGLDAWWIEAEQRDTAESWGYTVVDPATVMATHISHILEKRAVELFGPEEAQALLQQLQQQAPKVAEELVPKTMNVALLTKVLTMVMQEGISLVHWKKIAETLVLQGPINDPNVYVQAVRQALQRVMLEGLHPMGNQGIPMEVYTLHPPTEKQLQEHLQQGQLDAPLMDHLLKQFHHYNNLAQTKNSALVVLTQPGLRSFLQKWLRKTMPDTHVLGYTEIPDDFPIKWGGKIGVEA